jgi:hypothetical protein
MERAERKELFSRKANRVVSYKCNKRKTKNLNQSINSTIIKPSQKKTNFETQLIVNDPELTDICDMIQNMDMKLGLDESPEQTRLDSSISSHPLKSKINKNGNVFQKLKFDSKISNSCDGQDLRKCTRKNTPLIISSKLKTIPEHELDNSMAGLAPLRLGGGRFVTTVVHGNITQSLPREKDEIKRVKEQFSRSLHASGHQLDPGFSTTPPGSIR